MTDIYLNLDIMRHRIFLAVNLPEYIKSQLAEYQRRWPELPAKWTKRGNLHITLEFLGYIASEDLTAVLETARKTAAGHKPFEVNLCRISYGPPQKMPPRMVWAEGEKSKELGALKEDLRDSLINFGINYNRSINNKPILPHITLARIRAWDFRKIEPEERPQVEENISLRFNVDSVEVMESRLTKREPEYTVLESCELKK